MTVEGLETEQSVELVTGLGAQLGQGYVLARPMELAAADQLVHERARRSVMSRGA